MTLVVFLKHTYSVAGPHGCHGRGILPKVEWVSLTSYFPRCALRVRMPELNTWNKILFQLYRCKMSTFIIWTYAGHRLRGQWRRLRYYGIQHLQSGSWIWDFSNLQVVEIASYSQWVTSRESANNFPAQYSFNGKLRQNIKIARKLIAMIRNSVVIIHNLFPRQFPLQ